MNLTLSELMGRSARVLPKFCEAIETSGIEINSELRTKTLLSFAGCSKFVLIVELSYRVIVF